MKTYLNDSAFYVRNFYNGMIYRVASFESYNGYTHLEFNLSLVCGKFTDEAEYAPADSFSDECQTETVIQYIFSESTKEAFYENDYEIVENPDEELQKMIEKYMENLY